MYLIYLKVYISTLNYKVSKSTELIIQCAKLDMQEPKEQKINRTVVLRSEALGWANKET